MIGVRTKKPIWGMRYGSWWMVQWVIDWWVSFGIHIDLATRVDHKGRLIGPYIDLHLGFLIVSFGYHPAYTVQFDRLVSVSRGGLSD